MSFFDGFRLYESVFVKLFVVPPALGEDAFEKVSSDVKKLVIFESSGHSPMSNEPDLFVDEVLSFINSNCKYELGFCKIITVMYI